MDLVTKYIMTHSDGRSHPICGSAIAAAFCVSSVEVRRLVNVARTMVIRFVPVGVDTISQRTKMKSRKRLSPYKVVSLA